MASINTQTEDGRGDSLERQTHDSLGRQTPLLDGDLSDDSIEYDDEGIIRMRLAMAGRNRQISSTPSSVQTTRPNFPTVQDRTDDLLKDIRGRISALSDNLNDIRQQTRNLSSDFQKEDRRLDELTPLRRNYAKRIKNQMQQLEELNYLNGLIAYLQRTEKEMVLLPCRYDSQGDIFPCETYNDSFNDLSLAEMGESYREFSSDESATGLSVSETGL